METRSNTHVEDNFRQHATRAIALMCIVLGCVSVLIPLFYGITPWTGVIFTVVAYLTYRQSKDPQKYRNAAILLVTLLTLCSVVYAFVHGIYGALSFFLVLLSSLVASLTLSLRLGIILFAVQVVVFLPIAYIQYPAKEINYINTPILPDALMALLICGVVYVIIRIFSNYVTVLHGREHAHKKELAVYNSKMEEVLQNRLAELESQIKDRTKRLRFLAQRGKELSHITHDVSNTLTGLRLVLDQNLHSLPEKDRAQIESSFEYLRSILQDQQKGTLRKETESLIDEVVTDSLRLLEKSLRKHTIVVHQNIEKRTLRMRPVHLQRILSNIIQNSIDSIKEQKQKGEVRIQGKSSGTTYVLTVTDSGKGIPEHLLPLVSEPWFSTKGDNHMGMGLSSIQEILALYPGSSMTIDSKINRYTKITLKFPL